MARKRSEVLVCSYSGRLRVPELTGGRRHGLLDCSLCKRMVKARLRWSRVKIRWVVAKVGFRAFWGRRCSLANWCAGSPS